MKIIDTPWNTTSKLSCLSSAGVATVIRYYNFSNSSRLPEKRLTLSEAQHISSSGLSIAVVFQQRQNVIADFSHEKGVAAGKRAYTYARDHIGQTEGSGIYFGVDFDASSRELDSNIIPYFEGVQKGFSAESEDAPKFRVGAYGSGLVCSKLKEKDLITLSWLSMSQGFRGTKEAFRNGQYDICQKAPATKLCGLGVDFNERNPGISNFGEFALSEDEVQEAHSNLVSGVRYKVIARRGLRLRGGPGLQFEIIDGLRAGQIVHVTAITDGWASIDIEGDGQLDGFASAAFLELA